MVPLVGPQLLIQRGRGPRHRADVRRTSVGTLQRSSSTIVNVGHDQGTGGTCAADIGASHSARRMRAADVRAALRPGNRATRLAKTSEPTPTSSTESTGTVGSGTTLMLRANRIQSS